MDVWAIGCLTGELLNGEPIFPGESDIDQLYLIMKCFGNLTSKYRDLFSKNPLYSGVKLPDVNVTCSLDQCLSHISSIGREFVKVNQVIVKL